MRILRPDPELADFIESECRKGSWQGIIPRLWPNTKYIGVIVTGSMLQYVPAIDYYGNGLPIVSTMYASSECYFGINLNPLSKPSDVSYTFIPTMAYFEFLPVNDNNGGRDDITDSTSVPKSLNGEEQQELVDLVNVKLGQEYEVVVTTYAGNFCFISLVYKTNFFIDICYKSMGLDILCRALQVQGWRCASCVWIQEQCPSIRLRAAKKCSIEH